MNDKHRAAILSRIFSASVFKELATKGKSTRLLRLSEESGFFSDSLKGAPLSILFDRAFDLLKAPQYRNEYVYKTALLQKLIFGVHSPQTATLIPEFRVKKSKTDAVVLNGTSTAFEIKSERDRLDRLDQQISDYRRVFAEVSVIAGENHVQSIMDRVPNDVGIATLSNRFQISTIREAKSCVDRIDVGSVFDALSLKESLKILSSLDINFEGIPNTKIYEAARNKFVHIDPHIAHEQMISTLKVTRGLQNKSEFMRKLPMSLRVNAASANLRKDDLKRLVHVLAVSYEEAQTWIKA